MTVTSHGGPALSADGGGAVVAATVIGRGPVAIVYSGRLADTGAEVAVKVFPDRFDRDTASRLERERRALATVGPVPSILTVEAVREYGGDRSSVITQLCAGSLAGMLTRGALPVSEVLGIGAAMSSALAAAHEAGVVHGGVTPHNVLFRRSGEPVLGDFGLALRERFSRDPMHALEYTAPETLRDDTRSVSSDLYGLGAVLYATLTGAPPFPRRTGQAPGERILRVLRDPVPPIQAIPGDLSELVSLLLAKDPAARPADAARVAAWFDHMRGGRSTAVPAALNPLVPPVAQPDIDFDSFAGRPDLAQQAPVTRQPMPQPPFTQPPLARPSTAPLPLAPPPIPQQPSPQPPVIQPPATQLPLDQSPGDQPPLAQAPADQPPPAQTSAAQPPIPPPPLDQPLFAQAAADQPTLAQPSAAQPPIEPQPFDQPPAVHLPITPSPFDQPPLAPPSANQPPPAQPPLARPATAQPSVAPSRGAQSSVVPMSGAAAAQNFPVGQAFSTSVPQGAGRTLIYTAGGQEENRRLSAGRWKVVAGIGAGVVAVGVVAAVLLSGGDSESGAKQPPAPPTTARSTTESSAARNIGLAVTSVEDLGDHIELTWEAEGDLDFSVVVAGENIDTMVLVANRAREMSVPVDADRKYCFQIRGTDGRDIFTSEPVPVRGARCAL